MLHGCSAKRYETLSELVTLIYPTKEKVQPQSRGKNRTKLLLSGYPQDASVLHLMRIVGVIGLLKLKLIEVGFVGVQVVIVESDSGPRPFPKILI